MEKFKADREQKWDAAIRSSIQADFKVKKELRLLSMS